MAGYLSGNRIQLLVIGLVAISVISGGAATITESVVLESSVSEEGELGGGAQPGGGNGSGGAINGSDQPDGPSVDLQIARCIDLLNSVPGTIAYYGAFGLLIYGLRRRYNTGAALMAGFAIAPFVLTAYFLNTQCIATGQDAPGEGGVPTPNVGEQVIPASDISPVVLLGLLGVLLVAAAAVAVRATGDQYDELADEEDEDDAEGADVTDLAEAAGAAADRLQKHNADVDNAVYRAWWEMTQLLDVPNPDSATPGEFAEAAIDVGMSRDHVNQLTTLFEEVRYGRRDAESREERAVRIFRTIEEEYGASSSAEFDTGDGGGDGASGGDGR